VGGHDVEPAGEVERGPARTDDSSAHDGDASDRLVVGHVSSPMNMGYSTHDLYRASHSGLLDPRGSSTVRKEPGVLDMTYWPFITGCVPNGVCAVNRSGATSACSSEDPAVALA